jgi:hypothetical protein
MRQPHRNGLEETAEILAGLFYLLMAVALLAVLTASPGTALGLLVLGAGAHVLRVGLEGIGSSRGPQSRRRDPRPLGRSGVGAPR